MTLIQYTVRRAVWKGAKFAKVRARMDFKRIWLVLRTLVKVKIGSMMIVVIHLDGGLAGLLFRFNHHQGMLAIHVRL